MIQKRALVCQHRLPEFDRERGSQRTLEVIEYLQSGGWAVTFIALEAAGAQRYSRHLQQLGVRTFLGLTPRAQQAIESSQFDVAVLAFWHTAAVVMPVIRRLSPTTPIVVDSIDLHFLRNARRLFGQSKRPVLTADDGSAYVAELNVYADADAVLTVSGKEAEFLTDLTGGACPVHVVPLAETIGRSPFGFDERRGLLFIGNFRHLPNVEAVEFLLDEIVPHLDPDLLDEHPLSIVGHALTERAGHLLARRWPGVRFVGWVPSVEPYLARARASIVPLLHGAGVKGKLIQSLMTGTPVATTWIGAEGLDVVGGEHLLVGDGARELACAATRLLTDRALWGRLADRGHQLAASQHGSEEARRRLIEAVDIVAARGRQPAIGGSTAEERQLIESTPNRWDRAYASLRARWADRLVELTPPGSSIAVVSGGDDTFIELSDRMGKHFPHDEHGWHRAAHPTDGAHAIADVERQRVEGVGFLAVPTPSRWWFHHYRPLLSHLRSTSRIVIDDDDLMLFDLQASPVDAGTQPARLTVVIATHQRSELLATCLDSLTRQTAPDGSWDVVVIDDGSTDGTADVLARFAPQLPLRWERIEASGRSVAKNRGVDLATGDLVLFLDDDDVAGERLLEEHLLAHDEQPDVNVAVLGYTTWAPSLTVTPLMHAVTEVHHFLFAYPTLTDGQELDWRGFWEGRLSCKRALLTDHGLHDADLEYTIDIELAWRLHNAVPGGLRVIYRRSAESFMARELDFESFCRRCEAKGRAQAAIAARHPHPAVQSYCRVEEVRGLQDDREPDLAAVKARVAELELALPTLDAAHQEPELFAELVEAYRVAFTAHNHKGIADATSVITPASLTVDEPPVLSVIIPIWNTTPALAEMTERNVRRLRATAAVATEVVIIDNGSTYGADLAPDRHRRFDENLGVSVAWNAGAQLATGAIVAFLNNDVQVDVGWDVNLVEAIHTDHRRIAFPYTDHRDGRGFRRPDQGATAGWCFALARELHAELGPFDERFSPAFGEDTDYFHRAWAAGVDLTPVPAATVTHERRTTAGRDDRTEWLLQGHRFKYGWKHGVDPTTPPPFYQRQISDYWPPTCLTPKIFGIGLNKTGTTSLHAGLEILGFASLHWGGEEAYKAVLRAKAEGRRVLTYIGEHYHAYSDIGTLTANFELADRHYPGARFILTTRDLDAWLDSRRRHIERNRANKEFGSYSGSNLHVDIDAWVHEWRDHHDRVEHHFRDRPDDLLVVDLSAGDGWDTLAPFVGRDAPSVPFPHENQAPASS